MAIDNLQQSPEFQGVLQETAIHLCRIQPVAVLPLQFQTSQHHCQKVLELGGKQLRRRIGQCAHAFFTPDHRFWTPVRVARNARIRQRVCRFLRIVNTRCGRTLTWIPGRA